MYSPRSDTSDAYYSDHATLVDPVRDSIFSAGNTTLASHHRHHQHSHFSPHGANPLYPHVSNPPYPHVSNPPYIFAHGSQSHVPAPIPYLTQPVNPRESNSFRRHGDSVHFFVPPSNISAAQRSPKPPTNRVGDHQTTPARHDGHLAPGPYVTPHMSEQAPMDYLKINLRRRSVSYRNPSTASLYDVEKQDARNAARSAALATLEGRIPRNTITSAPQISEAEFLSSLVGPEEPEAQPVHPPVYPHSVLPESPYPYSNDRDGNWQVDEPVTLRRQERTRATRGQYTNSEVASTNGGLEYRNCGEEYESPSRVPQRTAGGNSPHPNAHYLFPAADEDEGYRNSTHDNGRSPSYEAPKQVEVNPFAHYQCKVRKWNINTRRYSDWMGGKVIKPFYLDTVDGVDHNYYYIKFEHPTEGPQEGWFFANRKEIEFNPAPN